MGRTRTRSCKEVLDDWRAAGPSEALRAEARRSILKSRRDAKRHRDEFARRTGAEPDAERKVAQGPFCAELRAAVAACGGLAPDRCEPAAKRARNGPSEKEFAALAEASERQIQAYKKMMEGMSELRACADHGGSVLFYRWIQKKTQGMSAWASASANEQAGVHNHNKRWSKEERRELVAWAALHRPDDHFPGRSDWAWKQELVKQLTTDPASGAPVAPSPEKLLAKLPNWTKEEVFRRFFDPDHKRRNQQSE